MHHLDQYLTTGHHSLAKLRHKINHHAMTCELKIGCEQTSRSLPVLTQGSLYSKERSPVLQAWLQNISTGTIQEKLLEHTVSTYTNLFRS